MTYFRFHLLFNFPLLAGLAWWAGQTPWTGGEWAALGWVLLAVMLFTSPWDNAAAKGGIWGFPREKFSFRLGYLPIEEYLFFILQSVNVMLALRGWLQAQAGTLAGPEWMWAGADGVRAGLVLGLWAAVGLWLWRSRPARKWNYTVHLLFWFLPVMGVQWALAPALLAWHGERLLALTAVFGTYYVIADLIAVRAGVWHFDATQIQGWKWKGILPWEEIAFFYLTSLLVAQSYLLLAPEAAR